MTTGEDLHPIQPGLCQIRGEVLGRFSTGRRSGEHAVVRFGGLEGTFHGWQGYLQIELLLGRELSQRLPISTR